MKNIEWRYSRGEVKPESLYRVEKLYGVILPEDYKQCISVNNGARPFPKYFDSRESQGRVFSGLLHYDFSENGSILDMFDWVKDRLPCCVFPFAKDPFGNLICFKYSGKVFNKIVFWDHETGNIEEICDTFSELLDLLYK